MDPGAGKNHVPFADFNWNCQDLTCNFTDNSRDDEGYETITARRWDFGDGTVIEGNQLTLSHTYASAGDRTVTLTATDNGGLSDDSSDRVNPRAPEARSLRMEEQPSSSATIGEAFNRQPEIELRIGNDRLGQAGVTVTASHRQWRRNPGRDGHGHHRWRRPGAVREPEHQRCHRHPYPAVYR